jgi:hypothetical protein
MRGWGVRLGGLLGLALLLVSLTPSGALEGEDCHGWGKYGGQCGARRCLVASGVGGSKADASS